MLACASRTPDKSGFKTRIISNSACLAEHAEQQILENILEYHRSRWGRFPCGWCYHRPIPCGWCYHRPMIWSCLVRWEHRPEGNAISCRKYSGGKG